MLTLQNDFITAVQNEYQFTPAGKQCGVYPACYKDTTKYSVNPSLHRHGHFELILITGGSGFHRTADGIQKLTSGMVICVPPGLAHYLYHTRTPLNRINIAFLPELLFGLESITAQKLIRQHTQLSSFYKPPYVYSIEPEVLSELISLACMLILAFHTYLYELKDCQKDYHWQMRLMLNGLINRIYCAVHTGSAADSRPEWIPGLLQFLEKEFHNPLDNTGIAERCGISVSSLMRLFKQHTGLRLREYIRHRRLHEARLMLSSMRVPVSRIALHVGYNDLSNFNHDFKKHFGCSPKEYLNKKCSAHAHV